MLIQVTQEHIDSGVLCNSYKCPVALALKDAKPDMLCTVGTWNTYIGPTQYNTQDIVKKFIRNFDAGLPVQPFEFELC